MSKNKKYQSKKKRKKITALGAVLFLALIVFVALLVYFIYFKIEDKSSFNESYEKKIARHEVLFNLEDLCECCKKVLKDNGNLCIVHRTDRLMEILEIFRKHNIEPKRIRFVYENISKESTLVLIEAQKCGSVGLKVESPIILYNLDGTETLEYKNIQEEVRK